MNIILDYYNKKIAPFGIWGGRRKRTMPLLESVRNKKILDVGCASGYIGEVLRKQGNYVVGIDIIKKDIIKAKRVLDEAYVFDIETGKTSSLGRNYDLIVMIEVVEHLFDPEKSVKRFLPLLKPKGRILLSTPNFAHIYNRLKVLLGIFEYKDETVINKSHIHFFTYLTFIKAIELSNLKIIRESYVIFPETLYPILRFWPNLFAHQVIILAEKN